MLISAPVRGVPGGGHVARLSENTSDPRAQAARLRVHAFLLKIVISFSSEVAIVLLKIIPITMTKNNLNLMSPYYQKHQRRVLSTLVRLFWRI